MELSERDNLLSGKSLENRTVAVKRVSRRKKENHECMEIFEPAKTKPKVNTFLKVCMTQWNAMKKKQLADKHETEDIKAKIC